MAMASDCSNDRPQSASGPLVSVAMDSGWSSASSTTQSSPNGRRAGRKSVSLPSVRRWCMRIASIMARARITGRSSGRASASEAGLVWSLVSRVET